MTITFFITLAIATFSTYIWGYNNGQKVASEASPSQIDELKQHVVQTLSIDFDDETIDILKRIDARTESIKEGISYLIMNTDIDE